MTHLVDTHVWVQRAASEPLPKLVEETLREHAETLARFQNATLKR